MLKIKKAAHSLMLAVIAPAVILPVFASSHDPIGQRGAVQIRALLATESGSASAAQPTTPAPTTTQAPTSSAAAPTSATPTSAVETTNPTSAAASSAANPTSNHATSAASSNAQPVATSVVPTIATDSAGQIYTTLVTTTPTVTSPSPSPTNSSNDTGGGLSTGSIIGLSVAGGIAALGIALFFVWKFTRKRFSDFEDNEAIKWPELNAHNNDGVHALPTNPTGRAGFGPENDSDLNLTRAPSPGGTYANSIAASSVREMYGDPYAVPPLPHLNPNQPYHDDPSAYGQPAGYYDPYRGPVPNTFTDAVSDPHGAEAIPMTQMARIRSPGPQAVFDMQGRASPAPQAAMGYAGMDERSRTPVPGALGAGRASPSPHAGYASYGPQ